MSAGLLLTLVVVAAGCTGGARTKAPPLQPPAVSTDVSYRAGPPLALPTTRPASATIAVNDALSVRVRWVALSRTPLALRPILSDATLISAPESAVPFLAAGQLSRGAQIVPAEDIDSFLTDVDRGKHGRHVMAGVGDAALPHGVTATFALSDPDRSIEIDLYRPPPTTATTAPSETIQVSLALGDVDSQRERLWLERKRVVLPLRFAVVLPWHAASSRVQAIVAIVELAPPSDSPEHAQAVADCAAKLQQLAAAGSPAGAKQSVAASNWPGLAAALRAMNRRGTARVAMVYLAGETGSELFGDVALVAPEPALADLSSRVHERLGDPVGAVDSQQLGWMLDVATLQHLAALQAAEKVPAEMAGVLARYAGEAARNEGSLEELTRVRGREQLRARLIAENFTYLEDASPSARVRAYEWLRARDRAPARYDPLGPSKERSAAIDAALTPPTTAPAEPPLQAAGGAP